MSIIPKSQEIDFQVAFENGTTSSYALSSSQDRGQMFIAPGMEVYKGQIVGIHQRPGDLSLNVCKKKAATNIRSNKDVTGQKHLLATLPTIALKNEM
jgi:GTP-binding protein